MRTLHKWTSKTGSRYSSGEVNVCEKCGLVREPGTYTATGFAFTYSRDGIKCGNTPCTVPLDADDKSIAEMYLQGYTVRSICRAMNESSTKGKASAWWNLNAIRSRITKIRKFSKEVL